VNSDFRLDAQKECSWPIHQFVVGPRFADSSASFGNFEEEIFVVDAHDDKMRWTIVVVASAVGTS
jgi:hypothetical protein